MMVFWEIKNNLTVQTLNILPKKYDQVTDGAAASAGCADVCLSKRRYGVLLSTTSFRLLPMLQEIPFIFRRIVILIALLL